MTQKLDFIPEIPPVRRISTLSASCSEQERVQEYLAREHGYYPDDPDFLHDFALVVQGYRRYSRALKALGIPHQN